ncbi:MAG: ArdC family protein [Thermomicrobiales bacterium]
MKEDIYQRVTTQIIQALEAGVRPWHQPWNVELTTGRIVRPLRSNLIPYRGINVLMLWGEAVTNGYAAPIWMTYKQAQELGGHVRKGERGTVVVYASTFTREEEDAESGDSIERNIPFLKSYTVFNAEQIEGLPARYLAKPARRIDASDRHAQAECFVRATGALIRHGGNRALYSEGNDAVQMPPFEAFESKEAYYATLIHELTHWTKHRNRLNRDLGRQRFGDAGYAMEELVAELGAAFALADLDLTPEPREEHASYIATWLKVLANDKRAIFSAAAHAQRAADYLHGLRPQEMEEAA